MVSVSFCELSTKQSKCPYAHLYHAYTIFILTLTLYSYIHYIGLSVRNEKSLVLAAGRRLKSGAKKSKRNQADQAISDSISSSPTTPTSTTPASSSTTSAVSSISPGNTLRSRVDSRESSVSINNGNNKVASSTPPDAISATTGGGAAAVSYVASATSAGAPNSSVVDYGYYAVLQHSSYQQQALGQPNSSYHDITQLTSTSSPAVVPQSTATIVSGQSAASFVTNTNTSSSNTNSSNSIVGESTEGAGYGQFQQQTPGSDLTSLDTHLAANATGVAAHHQHQFTPTFANHHHQLDLQQQQAADQLTIGYQPAKAANGRPTGADPLEAQHLQQPIHQSQQQHYNQQSHHQYNNLSSAMQQYNHHQLMIEQHYVNAMAANGEQQVRSRM